MELIDALYGSIRVAQKGDSGNAIDAADSRQAQLIECKADRLGMRSRDDLAACRIELGGPASVESKRFRPAGVDDCAHERKRHGCTVAMISTEAKVPRKSFIWEPQHGLLIACESSINCGTTRPLFGRLHSRHH